VQALRFEASVLPVLQSTFSFTCSTLAMIGEFGGIGAFVKGKEWWPNACHTYLPVKTPTDEANTYISMVEVRHTHGLVVREQGFSADLLTASSIHHVPFQTLMSLRKDISASVYTQITDVELEYVSSCRRVLLFGRGDPHACLHVGRSSHFTTGAMASSTTTAPTNLVRTKQRPSPGLIRS
jgi:hypothetical protein